MTGQLHALGKYAIEKSASPQKIVETIEGTYKNCF
jgi:hypothetical protein